MAFDDRDNIFHGTGIVGDASSEVLYYNDECTDAFDLTLELPRSGDSGGATQSLSACTGNADDDVWFKFTAGATGNATITVIPTATDGIDDIVFQMYSGTCGSLTSIACVDLKNPGFEELTTQPVTSGTTYYIRVYDFSATGANRGKFTIDYLIETAPANDECANAEAITSTSAVSGNTRGATKSSSDCTGDSDDDVWYKFTPSAGGDATITVTPSGTNPIDDIVFQLYDGSCGSLNSIVCVDAKVAGVAESTTQTVTGSTEYFVRVYDFDYQGLKRGEFTFQVTGISFVLPVELVSFRAKAVNEAVQLDWETASETNNEGFEVEWSVDSRVWQNIGFVKGAGNVLSSQFYQFLHSQARAGVNYYRLKQMDYDGNFEYSDVVSVQFAVDSWQLAVRPNPTQNGEVTLYISNEDMETAPLEIFNSVGQLVRTEVLTANQTTLRTDDLPKGLYWFSVNVNGQKMTEKVMVE